MDKYVLAENATQVLKEKGVYIRNADLENPYAERSEFV